VIPKAIDAALQLAAFPAENVLIPLECRIGIGHAQVHVMEAEQLGVFDHLDLDPERILDEPELEQAGGVTHRCENLGARRGQVLHLRFDIAKRQPEVVDDRAWAGVLVLREDDEGAAEGDAMSTLGRRGAQVLHVPLATKTLNAIALMVPPNGFQLSAQPHCASEKESAGSLLSPRALFIWSFSLK
jgi:hypothetical protein